jgi:hypothetical protein
MMKNTNVYVMNCTKCRRQNRLEIAMRDFSCGLFRRISAHSQRGDLEHFMQNFAKVLCCFSTVTAHRQSVHLQKGT